MLYLHLLHMSYTPSQQVKLHKEVIELAWWVLSIILAALVLLPIWLNAPTFPFFWENALFVILFVTFSRYIFFLSITPIARLKWIKAIFILATLLMVFVLSTAMADFRNFVDEKGLQTLVTNLHVTVQTRVMNYIKNEMIFFGVGSMIAGVALAIRLLISLWRMRNRGTI